MFESQLGPKNSGLAWSHYKCAAYGRLPMVVLQLKDPLELLLMTREFLPSSGFLSRCDMTYVVESEV